MNIQIFFRQVISQNGSKPLIVKGFCFFRMPNDCCFRWDAQVQLPQCNSRNIVTVLRTVVKSHKGLKGTKVFACRCFGRNLKNFSKFAGKSPWWSPFIVKLRPVIAFKKNVVKITRSNWSKRDAYTETLTQVFSVNFEKNYEHDYSARLPLKQCQIKSLLFRI